VGRGDSSPECITAAFHGIVAAMSGECASTTIWAGSGAYAAEHVIASAIVPPHMPPVHRTAPPHTWVFHRFVPISRGLFRRGCHRNTLEGVDEVIRHQFSRSW